MKLGVTLASCFWVLLSLGTIAFLLSPVRKWVEIREPPDLTVYAESHFGGEEGFASELAAAFERKYDCRVAIQTVGNLNQLLGRLKRDQLKHQEQSEEGAKVLLGLDRQAWARVKPWVESWGNWKPQGYEKIPRELKTGDGFLPFDLGIYSLILDQEGLDAEMRDKPVDQRTALEKQLLDPIGLPISLTDLKSPLWRKNFLLQDPRTSAPGLAFLLFSREVLGPLTQAMGHDFWKSLRQQWLTLTPGWGGAYRLFLRGEANWVWSYVTSQAYHQERGDSLNPKDPKKCRYRAVLFREGQPTQIEGAAILGGKNSSASTELARKFLEFLISEEVQKGIPKKIWMMPARRGVVLPESFLHLPKPTRLIFLSGDILETESAIQEWNSIVHEVPL